ncbi:hypothetical protein [Billgrantia hypersalina]|uniref:hypothetical protein n=1 Tax=Billgrantia sp. LNSP4103-1 TaxID=3410266 RepID=UPI00403F8898
MTALGKATAASNGASRRCMVRMLGIVRGKKFSCYLRDDRNFIKTAERKFAAEVFKQPTISKHCRQYFHFPDSSSFKGSTVTAGLEGKTRVSSISPEVEQDFPRSIMQNSLFTAVKLAIIAESATMAPNAFCHQERTRFSDLTGLPFQ